LGRYRYYVALLLTILLLRPIGITECGLKKENDGSCAISVSCIIDVGSKDLDEGNKEAGLSTVDLEQQRESMKTNARRPQTGACKIDPVFAFFGVTMMIGSFLLLIECISNKDT